MNREMNHQELEAKRKVLQRKRMNWSFRIAGILLVIALVVLGTIDYRANATAARQQEAKRALKAKQFQAAKVLANTGFVNLDTVMKLAGYQVGTTENPKQLKYLKSEHGVNEDIVFDQATGQAHKGPFNYEIKDKIKQENGAYYMQTDALAPIINKVITANYGQPTVADISHTTTSWRSQSVIAHAGGALRKDGKTLSYTNSYDAMVQSYNLGYRTIELDMCLTSDGKLALVHDWQDAGYAKAPTAAEWMKDGVRNPQDGIHYQPMLLDDVFKLMEMNKDLYIITDSKSFEYTNAQIKEQFRDMVDAAKQYSPDVLDRVIPQIYNEQMYPVMTSVHKFPSVIYTLYRSKDLEWQVVDFVKAHPEINTVTVPKARLDKYLYSLVKNNVVVYTHTIDDINQLKALHSNGVRGFYSNDITPQAYNSIFAGS
ncbi:hypothetical protein EQG49_01445 [Periweissella cryptocerci]|uniref:GP-PDE domain-containing protein n=1 Tax=Periweissella cryptocerci TaxID=2506420 RepID=A0A4P6YRF8_9LACO|nr:glycerophosphodiester phosphodiesterase family protein [Periweissella cryptocerci]QBO35214.1 hypothetical protein EQG49_01445 [Periweissella cryptocerci]